MLIGLKASQDLLQQLIAVQAVMRCPSRSDAMRRLIEDAYQKFFADKVSIDTINRETSNDFSPREAGESK